jgi:hypothetical protein
MSKAPKKVNYAKWSVIITFVIGVPGAIATLATFPEIGCKAGLPLPSCNVPQKKVEFVTQTETGELLPNVKVEVIANKGAPEVQYTDTYGYVKVNVPSKGDVKVVLSKQGYPTQNFTINLENNQDTIRTIKLSQSGQPNVIAVASLPASPIPSDSPSPTPFSSASPTPSPDPSPPTTVQVDGNVTWELKSCIRQQKNVSCAFVINTAKEINGYDFALSSYTKITDYKGREYYPSKGRFVSSTAEAGAWIARDIQKYNDLKKGPTYDVTIDFDFKDAPASVSEVNSLIIYRSHSQIRFDGVPIKPVG